MTVENVLLVTIDSLRHDFREIDAPTITELAEQGASFQQAFATGPGTTASFPAILGGSYPLSYGGIGKLSEDRPFLARELQSRGMATAGFHSNPFLTEAFNYHIGFETFEDYQDSLMNIAIRIFPQGIEKSVIPEPVTTTLKKSFELVRGKPRPYEQAEVITDDAIKWLKTASDGFFEWVHYMDVHHPCFPPESYLREFDVGYVSNGEISDLYSQSIEEPGSVNEEDHRILVDSYRASIRYVDDEIDRLLSTLREEGRFEETLVIVTSDHGQTFGNFGGYGKPYRLYDALIKVPLIIKNAPVEFNEKTEELVSLVDIPPLIHSCLGFEKPDRYEGNSPLTDKPRNWIIAEHQVGENVIVGARTNNMKYIVDGIMDEERAFEIELDGEATSHIDDVQDWLRERVLARLDETDVNMPEYVSHIDSTVENRLEKLGYL